MTHIDWQSLPGRYTYSHFRELMTNLLAEGKTTGPDQSPAMINYTELNAVRMRRLEKRSRLTEESLKALEGFKRPLVWLSITEAWCGDAAQILPVLEQLAQAHPMIEHHLILRDEHPEIMDAFLTNGARSIPVTIVLDKETNEVLGHWGPRPAELQAKVMAAKAASLAAPTPEERREIREQAKVETQKWYARDKTLSTQNEVLQMIGAVAATED
ncbi:MAG: thioredoxin family protein [Bacteroidota bacterium]